ncbi:P-loop NTPase fold protein [Agrobacterium rosae]|uniref:P-loop NTPase fold protein n=1 Tax=Agrobacterium rosae TaxID=1972867 RepID=UPI003A80C45F
MATEIELLEALNSSELKGLALSTEASSIRPLLERGLRQRRAEIELELSKTTASRDAAIAALKTAEKNVADQTRLGSRPILVGAAIVTIVVAISAAIVSVLSEWLPGKAAIASWSSPFSETWWISGLWTALYLCVLIVLWETDFYFRRRPKRLTRVEHDQDVAAHRVTVKGAGAARRAQLLALVREHVTEMLNANQGPRFSLALRVKDHPTVTKSLPLTVAIGLSEVSREDNRVATSVQQRVLHLLASLSGASIGISGPRGVGKSTLLTALCGANPTVNDRPAIAILTSAPIEYDAREFLLHLFSTLCRKVLQTEGVGIGQLERDAFVEARYWRRSAVLESFASFSRLLILAGMSVIMAAMVLVFIQSALTFGLSELTNPQSERSVVTSAGQPSPQSTAQTALSGSPDISKAGTEAGNVSKPSASPAWNVSTIVAGLVNSPLFTFGLVAVISGYVLVVTRPFRRSILNELPLSDNFRGRSGLIRRAQMELRNIAFQRSYTSGWSGSLKVPVGFDFGSTSGITLAQRPESLPELVERFRTFVADVANAYNNIVIIGIDELDKLKTAQQAEGFINGVKSVFGIPGCFYLISVSENALAAFERRGIGFRDAFDSALDDVVQVDFLNLEQSRALLNRRILRLTDPFLQLCHMLSGGLPRDLIRHARALLEEAERGSSDTMRLKKAVEELVSQDLAARIRATSISMRNVKEIQETSALLIELSLLPLKSTVSAADAALVRFRRHLAKISSLRVTEEGRLLLRFAEELSAYYQSMILLRRVAAMMFTLTGWEKATKLGLADGVAGVRQALEVSIPLAELRLAELRKSVDEATASDSNNRKARTSPLPPLKS